MFGHASPKERWTHTPCYISAFAATPPTSPPARNAPPGVRLLGALRVWRVARVMNTLLLSADEAHDETKDTLRLAEQVKRNVLPSTSKNMIEINATRRYLIRSVLLNLLVRGVDQKQKTSPWLVLKNVMLQTVPLICKETLLRRCANPAFVRSSLVLLMNLRVRAEHAGDRHRSETFAGNSQTGGGGSEEGGQDAEGL